MDIWTSIPSFVLLSELGNENKNISFPNVWIDPTTAVLTVRLTVNTAAWWWPFFFLYVFIIIICFCFLFFKMYLKDIVESYYLLSFCLLSFLIAYLKWLKTNFTSSYYNWALICLHTMIVLQSTMKVCFLFPQFMYSKYSSVLSKHTICKN